MRIVSGPVTLIGSIAADISFGVIHDRAKRPRAARRSEVVNNSAVGDNSVGGRPASARSRSYRSDPQRIKRRLPGEPEALAKTSNIMVATSSLIVECAGMASAGSTSILGDCAQDFVSVDRSNELAVYNQRKLLARMFGAQALQSWLSTFPICNAPIQEPCFARALRFGHASTTRSSRSEKTR